MSLSAALLVLALAAVAAALPFPYLCPQIPPHAPPTNVRELRANDISMVMTIGDSMVRLHVATLALL